MVQKKKVARPEKLLTDVELEMMSILWRRGSGTVSDVQADLPPERKLAYTSISTMLRILEQKQILQSKKEGRGHVYSPLLKKDVYETRSLNHLVSRVFGGAPTLLIQRLIETEGLSDDDIEGIKKLLDERRNP